MVAAPPNGSRAKRTRDDDNDRVTRSRRQSGINDFFQTTTTAATATSSTQHRQPSQYFTSGTLAVNTEQPARRERQAMSRRLTMHTRQQSTNNNHRATTPTPGSHSEQRVRGRREQTPSNSSSVLSPVHENRILSGVVACLDVRTDDGDDVSQNFERALQSMGAKTRRTFSDSVTHLIFKNGSAATLKKAISKDVFIVNLLWVSRCKREGRRIPEAGFLIERPQGLVVAGTKKRKSMEPGKVKPLNDLEPSSSTSSEGSIVGESIAPKIDEIEPRRKTIATTSWRINELKKSNNESELRKREIAALAEEEKDNDEENAKAGPSRYSLPASVESLTNRHTHKRARPAPVSDTIIPIHPPDSQKKEEIKARFSIGQARDSNQTEGSSDLDATRLSLNSPPISNVSTPLKRKRRLTGSLPKPVANTDTSNSNSRNNDNNNFNTSMIPQSKFQA